MKLFKVPYIGNGVVYWAYRSSRDPMASGISDKALVDLVFWSFSLCATLPFVFRKRDWFEINKVQAKGKILSCIILYIILR